jgi:predicted RNase H-like nuclease
MDTVLGVDACKTGWVGIAWSGGAVTPLFAPTITELVDAAGPLSVIGIDIPIGLPDRGYRQADLQAREFIGARRSSVFLTPVRATLGIRQHQRANAVNQERTGKGLSIQAFSLLPKIQEVDDWKPKAPCQVVEVHPEVSFTQLGEEPPPPKKSWTGAEHRRALLAEAGIKLTGDLGAAGKAAAVDDVLDAAVAAWTARRVHLGTALTFPNPPETLADGSQAAIWR